jgi:hypothetical protein
VWDDLRPSRLCLAPVSHVDLVHFREVGHVGQKDVDLDEGSARRSCEGVEQQKAYLDSIVDVRTGGLEDSC